MSIEIRQMVVKSNVVQRCESDDDEAKKKDQEKRALFEECRQVVLETLREMKER